jgi:hypothetical protein
MKRLLARDPVRVGLEILGVWTVTVAMPVLSALGEHPEHFALRDADRADLLLLAAIILLGVPLVAAAIVSGVMRLQRDVGEILHAFVLAVLIAVYAMDVLSSRGSNARAIAALVAIAAAGFLFLMFPGTLAWPRLLSLAAPVAFVMFLTSPVGALLRSGRTELDTGPTNGRPVVMVVLDELPVTTLLDDDGRVDAERFPAFARLAAHGTFYPDTTTVAPFTQEAVPSMLTGRYPDRAEPLAPTAASHPENLFSLLGGSYDLHAYEHLGLCEVDCGRVSGPPRIERLSQLLDDSVEVLRRRIFENKVRGTFEFGPDQGPREVERLEAFIDDVARYDGGPALYFVHALLPHKPYQYLPDGTRYRAGGILFGRTDHPGGDATYASQAAADYLYRRHLAQTMYTDQLLGELIDAMEQVGLWDDAVIIVTADHGEAFIVGEPRRRLTAGNLLEVTRVPLFVARPDAPRGRIIDDPRSTIDIIPMLADALDVDLPYTVDGSTDGTDDREVMGAARVFMEVPPDAPPPRPDPLLSRSPFGPRHLEGLLGAAVPEPRSCTGHATLLVDVVDDSPPVYVVGQLDDPGTGTHDLAFASGGTIVGATTTFLDDNDLVRYGALLDPALLGNGDIRAYLVQDSAEARLTPLCTTSPS